MGRSLDDRFFSRVRMTSGCWIWTGASPNGRYGVINIGGKNVLVHRLAYEQLVGPIPRGCEVDHLCRNGFCVRPDHLEAVTHRENVLRGTGATAQNAAKTHCKNGHPLSGSNLRLDHKGGRVCRICATEARRQHYEKDPERYREYKRRWRERQAAR